MTSSQNTTTAVGDESNLERKTTNVGSTSGSAMGGVDAVNEKEMAMAMEGYSVPDGGLEAWMTVAGAWLVLFATYGYIYAFGVYQDYYTRFYLSNHSASAISWIGSVQLTSPFILAIISGKLFDKGYFHFLEISGAIIYIVSLFMLSLAKQFKYYQIFLSQGLGVGLGLGLIFIPTVSITNHHFAKRKALAVGLSLSGSAFGAIVLPIMFNNLLKRHSFGSSVRGTAYLVTGCLIIGNLLMRTRLPPKPKEQVAIGTFFKERSFLYVLAAAVCISFGITFPVFYIQLFAVLKDVDPTLAFYSLAILNAASVFGRIIGNFLADHLGPFNVMTPTAVISGGLIWAMLGIKNEASLVLVSLFFGLFSGAYLSLTVSCAASLAKRPQDVGAKTGVPLAISGITLLISNPISGHLLGTGSPLDYNWTRAVAFAAMWTLGSGIFWGLTIFELRRERGGVWKV